MEVLLAQQPIFDRRLCVVAYELLYRPAQPGQGMRIDELATWHVLSTALFDLGLSRLLKGRRGFVNVSEELLLDERIRTLPSREIGLEVLESAVGRPEAVKVCRQLRREGFAVAVDDYTGQPALEPYLAIVDWVKVDYRLRPGPPPARAGARFLAEKLETEAEFHAAAAQGYSFFQGYFLERPVLISGQRLPPGVRSRMELIVELTKAELDLARIEQLIARDPALCYRLLRFVNSAQFSHRQEIASVRQTLLHLGERAVRRWISLVLLPELTEGRPPALVPMSAARARLCELVARQAGLQSIEPQAFLAGLLSLLGPILRRPLDELTEELGLQDPVRSVLVSPFPSGQLGWILHAAKALEAADWNRLTEATKNLDVSLMRLEQIYLDAVVWAREVQQNLRGREN